LSFRGARPQAEPTRNLAASDNACHYDPQDSGFASQLALLAPRNDCKGHRRLLKTSLLVVRRR
jgi:hypothetical protein